MGKKSKKRTRRKSSSSSEEDEGEKESKKQDAAKNCRGSKRKHDMNNQERCAAKEQTCAFPTVKDVSQSTRPTKKPVYRLAKTQATDQKPLNKEEECTKAKCAPVSFRWLKYSSKVKNYSPGKDYTAFRSKNVEGESTKSFNTNTACPVPHRTKEMSKGSLGEKSPQKGPSELKKQLVSLVSARQKEQAQNVLQRKCSAQVTSRTGNESSTVKARGPSKTSKYSTPQKGRDMSLPHQEIKFKATRNLCTDTKRPAACRTEQSSTLAKHTTSVSGSPTAKSVTPSPGNARSAQHATAKSTSAKQQLCPLLDLDFKIPKKVRPGAFDRTRKSNEAVSTRRNLRHGTELSNSSALMSKNKQEAVQPASSCLDATASFTSEVQVTEQRSDQMQVVEELHLARSERRLGVDIMQSYGELTCMDIDPPEEGAGEAHCRHPLQQNLILVLDTNILLSHLDYVKKIGSQGLGAMGFPVVLIPWVVLQEMDSLKKGKGLSGSVAHLAIPAISYIYKSLKSREPHMWGQSMQQAAESSNGLNAENNDDRVLQCCLQYQSLYPECALILCTNDKNLCSKALLSGVSAFSKNDLEAEAGTSTHGFHPLQSIKPHTSRQASSPMLCTSYTSGQPHSGERADLVEKDDKQLRHKADREEAKWDLSRCVSELEDCLREVLSDVLEVEMKAVYEDLWLEIVCLKPPWTLQDVLQCLKKHWVAVFGQVVPRRKVQNVSDLISFFNSGTTADRGATLAALKEAKELVKVFGKRSSRVPRAIATMDDIFKKLQPQSEPPACDVVMNEEDEEEKQPTSTQVSPQEVWALFENIWSNVYQISLEVFKALGFDPHTMQSPQPAGGLLPPQDVLACLHKLSSMVSQLLQGFSSALSSAPSLEEVQTLLNVIHCNKTLPTCPLDKSRPVDAFPTLAKHVRIAHPWVPFIKIVDVDSRLTAKDLLDCFSQQDYRERLSIGGNQLMELKGALDICVRNTGQHSFPTQS